MNRANISNLTKNENSADLVEWLLLNTNTPADIQLSDIRKILQRLKKTEKIQFVVASENGHQLNIILPHPELFKKEAIEIWMRYHLAATYVRAMALGHPNKKIYMHIVEDIKNKQMWEKMALNVINQYFISHRETLLHKAQPITKQLNFYISPLELRSSQKNYYNKSLFQSHSESHLLNLTEPLPIVLGFDQGARGINVAIFRGRKNITTDVLGEDSELLQKRDKSYYYQYTFPYGEAGGSGQLFVQRMAHFIEKV
ncbi:MAG: hypothetical protein KDD40_11940, partial [Bdellovibrionales bacterium]|nr:hypothetical protein [Bdellovibrionales bacterium]